MIKAIDFFCGAGGLTRGLLDAGISVLAGVDNDRRLQKTYELNNSPSKFISYNINDVNITSLREELGINDRDIVLYAACTPCQPFSMLNRLKKDDDRKNLLLSFCSIVEKAPPDFILVENVPVMSTVYGKAMYEEFVRRIKAVGFTNIFTDFLDAKDYGVPQTRKRFIMIASREAKLVQPRKLNRVRHVKDAIRKYPRLKHGQDMSNKIPNHACVQLADKHLAIVRAVPKNGGKRQDILDENILLKCHQGKPGNHRDVFARMSWDRPSPTLTSRCCDVYCGRFTHPSQNRAISLREAAALQSFGDDYVFYGSLRHISKQIGNAVPVNLSRQLGKCIVKSEVNHARQNLRD